MECKLSDGTDLYVPDTTKMAMKPNGPKYHQQLTNEPKKQHPQVGGVPNAKPEWLECVVTK